MSGETAIESGTGDVDALFRAGQRIWPGVDLGRRAFAEYLEARVEVEKLAQERAADLYLACACAAGIPRAIEQFTATFGADLARIAARTSAPGMSPDDATQMVYDRLLVGDGERPPKIESYRGVGALRNWVRATAARLLIDVFRAGGRGREVAVEQALIDELAGGGDPEIDYLKAHYRGEFSRAFESAIEKLAPRKRNHLRHVFVDALTIDQIAALYGVHRSTAARRVASAREELLSATHAELAQRLAIGSEEVKSVVRLIGSRFDLSVDRIFRGRSIEAEPSGGGSSSKRIGGADLE